ncbi:MAG: plasmid pRiA4b ORF-3 family protein [Firmicutes bacterium]|nr:plasmid pRiA4b ORF-3 family protein [Bacillota bacterium]
MQIALTKKLADAIKNKPPAGQEDLNPLFTWTANWTNVYQDGADDLLILVNNATRFVAAVYPFGKKDLEQIEQIMIDAIRNTLLAFNFNPEMVNEYFHLAGEVKFSRNSSRAAASWVSKAGLDCAIVIGNTLTDSTLHPKDTLARTVNYWSVSLPNKKGEGVPYQEMSRALAKLTKQPIYSYRAFELLVTLDLETYKAERRLIVPASIDFFRLHEVLQSVFNWDNCHLYDFTIPGADPYSPLHRLVPFEDDLEYDPSATLLNDHKLQDFLPKYKELIYTYDFGDNWEHRIRLVKVLDEYSEESPFLLAAKGKTPPEDVGGIPGFLYFLEVLQDPQHPEHTAWKEWAGYWDPELFEWEKKPRLVW